MKASDLFVRCLENEGIEYVFGVPGEENADVMMSLVASSDPWLRACGVFALPTDELTNGRTTLESACDDPDPVVRETARHRLGQLA